jgi:hypothetical protein
MLLTSLRVTRHAQGPHMIGRECDLTDISLADVSAGFAPILNVNVYRP